MMMDEDDVDTSVKVPPELSAQLEVIFSRHHMQPLFDDVISKSNLNNYTSVTLPKNPFLINDDSFHNLSSICKVIQFLLSTQNKNKQSLLNTLSYSNGTFLVYLWSQIKSRITMWSQLPSLSEVMSVFVNCYDSLLITLDDSEFLNYPFHQEQCVEIVITLRDLVFDMYWNGCNDMNLRNDMTRLLSKLHSTDARLKYCKEGTFVVKSTENMDYKRFNGRDLLDDDLESDRDSEMTNNEHDEQHRPIPIQQQRYISLRNSMINNHESHVQFNENDYRSRIILILKNIPYVVPFETRVKAFSHFINLDKESLDDYYEGASNIRRQFIFEDGFAHFNRRGSNLKGNLLVQMINADGHLEAGIGQGVTKEFLIELAKVAFNPQYGLFNITPDQTIYPNPASHITQGDDHLSKFNFLGKIVGKAMYERILLDIPFAHFFLSKLLGNTNFFNHLKSLDPELHKHLITFKNYPGDVKDLDLTFTISDELLGTQIERELVPDGSNQQVTNQNKMSYIYRVSNHRLNTQIKEQSQAFMKGLAQIIPTPWLKMFDENELFLLMCGTVKFNVDDMENHTTYYEYSHDSPTIQMFWKVVKEFNEEQKRMLLRFWTSGSRPPLLGFKDMHPPLCIRNVVDTSRLPTSSTCMNLLKLPPYKNMEEIKKKILLAIMHGNEGFELT
ncbi:ubiquitin-protein ligase E3 [Acrasis kona]|uniref:HECT-type E3 ubiquitin transferase n=1 Tax=Acrasis kona TaxID=1008807 RepID=A0AAW2ZMX2_9EUKA